MASAASSISSRSFAQAPAVAGPIVVLGRVLFALIFVLSDRTTSRRKPSLTRRRKGCRSRR
jgi:hypothetical protein